MSWRAAPTLTGRHVTLRPLDPSDRAAVLAVVATLPHVFATTLPNADTIDTWFADLGAQAAAGRAMPFAVLDADGAVVGATRYLRMNEGHRRLEVGGTFYAAPVQRTAVNTEAKRLILGHAFERLGAACVQLRTNFLNRPSRAAIERLGARLDGVLRGHMIDAAGNARDTVVYSILAHEWPQVRRGLDVRLEQGARA